MKCQTAVVYERNVEGRLLTVGNTREFIARTMVLDDVETRSQWNQATGIAVLGHFTGTELRTLAASTTSLGAWLATYPNSGVLAPTTQLARAQRVRMWDPDEADAMLLLVRAGGATRAYPLDRFPEDGLIHDVLGDEPIAILFGRQPKVLAAYSRRIGEEVVEFDPRSVPEDIELRERSGPRRWSAISGRSRPLRSARPLRPLASMPIDRIGFEVNFRGVSVFGGRLPPRERLMGDRRALESHPADPIDPANATKPRGAPDAGDGAPKDADDDDDERAGG